MTWKYLVNQPSSGTSPATLRLEPPNIILAGPPGSGKSSVGRLLGKRLKREFIDTDALVEQMSGKAIDRIFEDDGEIAFRKMEAEACRRVAAPADRVIACGGGALLDRSSRALLEAGGMLVCLTGEPETLLERIGGNGQRPLLNGDSPADGLHTLLAEREAAYESIPRQVDTTALTVEQVADRITRFPLSGRNVRLTAHRPRPGYDILLGDGLLSGLAARLEEANLPPPYLVVTDSNVAPLFEQLIRSTLDCSVAVIPAGETFKSQETLTDLYADLIHSGMDRAGTVIALGGGVVLDLAGFAAATYMRGVNWAALPTSLLAIVDASLGGKVGINLSAGKNLIGAIHAPRIVLADLGTLDTLPEQEIRTGLAEMIKAALIGDSDLFERMESEPSWISRDWIQRSIAVKLRIVDEDPREKGMRSMLNLGHTFAHAFEKTSGYRLSHGQAVSVGLLAATRLAHALGRCETDLPDRVQRALERFGLPTSHRGLQTDHILGAMAKDKKSRAGRVRFVLPRRPGKVEFGIEAPEAMVHEILEGLQ